jgi:hypothetical protein
MSNIRKASHLHQSQQSDLYSDCFVFAKGIYFVLSQMKASVEASLNIEASIILANAQVGKERSRVRG